MGTDAKQATGANFASSFSLNPGVIIADHNVGVKYAAGEGPPIDEETTALTHIQQVRMWSLCFVVVNLEYQWSDAVWMQWVRNTNSIYSDGLLTWTIGQSLL
jgi:hypothetical protein